eukprot:Plantae.Rhodophyta-Palmaria_palmata.ctg13350.p1 GENE.Plantae.Rhodophyta-Palmaria_palmata.ctg13350~~Plantae.Rhodophyta-Palmaria_palmata.ctg13350.p1  ORF type:complete len:101 (-),score=1.17 Plantae.Rhodophyta-Palmaria_palmata.ctg13350:221-523(-)
MDNQLKQRSTRKPAMCAIKAGQRQKPHRTVMAHRVLRKRKELVADVRGTATFVLVTRELNTARNYVKTFPNTESGDIVQDFEDQRILAIRAALQAKLVDL